ncbi:MAG: M56 family metallopeptidase [Phycisphaerae bacterium]|nr:M56 family metallopeptidase [Phycisphaerae bacterium]
MTPMHVAINALAQVTAWLAVVFLAMWLVRSRRQSVQWRVLLLRIGLAGVPVVLAVGSFEHILPWVRPLWRLAKPVAAESSSARHQPLFVGASSNSASPAPVDMPAALPKQVSIAAPVVAPKAAGMAANAWSIVRLYGPRVLGVTLLAVWAGGALVCLCRLAVGLLKLRIRRRKWEPVQAERIRELASRLAGSIGLRRPFRLLACDELPMPVATGICHPAVVLPREQFGYLASPEGRAVLAHELAHLRYNDPLWRLFGAVVGALLWFHPLMHWMNRQIEIEAEFQCDQAALQAGADKRDYARLLVDLAELAWSDRPLAIAAIGAVHRTSHLEQRLTAILSKGFGGVMSMSRRTRWAAFALSSLLIVSLSSVALLGEDAFGVADESGAVTPAAVHVDKPAAAVERPADRVIVTLVTNQRLEGLWLGSTSQNVRILSNGAERVIAMGEVAEIQIVRPGGPKLERADAASRDIRRPAGSPLSEEHRAVRKLVAEAEELAKAGSRESAIEKLEEARRLAPNHPAPLRMLLKTYRELGRMDKARQVEKVLREIETPLSPEVSEEIARLRQRISQAEADLAAARTLDLASPGRDEQLSRAERELQQARDTLDQFHRRMGKSAGGAPGNWATPGRSAGPARKGGEAKDLRKERRADPPLE